MRNKTDSHTYHSMYKYYKANSPYKVEYSLYKRILDRMSQIIAEAVLDRSEGFKMPCGLGYIQVGKYQPKNYNSKSLSIDYKLTREYGKVIYHLNEHSNGYKYRLHWSKVPITFADRYKYQLCLVRANKRKLAQLIFNKHDYLNINDIQICKM